MIKAAAIARNVDRVGKGGGVFSPSGSGRCRTFRDVILNQGMGRFSVSEGLTVDHRQVFDDR
ncbi:hypothetical protein, partial [Mesorhizobium sp. M0571]|uniref:hypothetical protein n=1 Tax=Mesorhizobium sp. M0571 TaxID=2956960 RepID=UPI00333ABDCE